MQNWNPIKECRATGACIVGRHCRQQLHATKQWIKRVVSQAEHLQTSILTCKLDYRAGQDKLYFTTVRNTWSPNIVIYLYCSMPCSTLVPAEWYIVVHGRYIWVQQLCILPKLCPVIVHGLFMRTGKHLFSSWVTQLSCKGVQEVVQAGPKTISLRNCLCRLLHGKHLSERAQKESECSQSKSENSVLGICSSRRFKPITVTIQGQVILACSDNEASDSRINDGDA